LDLEINGENINLSTIKISAKCSDLFSMEIIDNKNNLINKYNGYVPKFITDRYGDFVEFEIDINTGKILNWNPDKKLVEEFLLENQ
jgi:hypothetical protein